jgi:hypothetical protein
MNYKEWSEKAESEFTCEFSRDGIRDVYPTPFGIKLYHEVFMPRNIFVNQSELALVDVIIHRSKEEWLKEKYGINWLDYNRYTEDDYGYPIFLCENSLEKGFNFAMKFNKEILPNIQ